MRPSLVATLALSALLYVAADALRVHRALERGDALALTASLGGGYGITLRGPRYYALHPLERESVEVHEAVHRQQATWLVWPGRVAAQEREAYEAMLVAAQARRTERLARGDVAGALVLWAWERGAIEPHLR